MSLTLSAAAERDIISAIGWYDSQKVGLGSLFVEAVAGKLAEIEEHPLHYPQFSPNSRRHFRFSMVRRFPYRIICEIKTSDTIVVLAVAHTSRKPDYWQH